MVGAVATPVGATGVLPPDNPATNVVPSPNFLSSGLCHDTSVATPCTNPCVRLVGPRSNLRPVFPSFSGTPTCTQFLLRALNVARADEELPAIVLPTNWFQLKPQEQIFVIVDLERTARGLPPYLGLNRQLHASAQFAAAHEADPGYARGFGAGLDSGGFVAWGARLRRVTPRWKPTTSGCTKTVGAAVPRRRPTWRVRLPTRWDVGPPRPTTRIRRHL